MAMTGLSKSRITAYEQCPRRLWLEVHQRELAQIDEAAQARFAAGDAIGAEACRQVPGGIMIRADHGLAAAIDATRDAIAEDQERPIFEATFVHEGVLIRADILQFVPDRGWYLTEVKSAGSVKAYHLGDLATQAWVLEGNGLALADARLAHVDTGFRLRAADDYHGLFRHASVLELIRPIMATRGDLVAEIQQVVTGDEPEIAPGDHCSAPFTCAFTQHCSVGLPAGPEWPVTVLPGGAGRKWLERGIDNLFDLPREKLISAVHQRVYDATVTGEPWHDIKRARRVIADWAFPRTWLDFETIGFVMPRWVGTGPYGAVPFQFSAQIEQADGQYAERTFLDLSGGDPRRACAEALLQLPAIGAVIAYNAGFERNCIKGLADACPDLAEELMAIADRLVDLLPVTRAHWYHRDQRGSWSIKAVLPTVAPELDYSQLAVGNGMAAQEAYLEAVHPNCCPARKAAIERDLRIYCARDTEAMIVLARHLAGHELDDSYHEAILDNPAAEAALQEARTAHLTAQGFTATQIARTVGTTSAKE